MKKRLLMILLVVALLVTAAVFAVQADPTTTPTDPRERPCPCSTHNGTVPNASEWTVNSDSVPTMTDGLHWYMPGGITPGSTVTINGDMEVVIAIPEGKNFNCTGAAQTLVVKGGATVHLVGEGGLCGKGLSGVGGIVRVFTGGTLHIHDNIKIWDWSTDTAATNGGLVRIQNGGHLIMDDGTLTAPANLTGNGGAIILETYDATYGGAPKFTMNGGTINASAVPAGASRLGGAIFCNQGEVTIQGTAQITGTTKAINQGGAIWCHSNTYGKVTIADSAQITGGNAVNGGSIYMLGRELSISGSATISGGQASESGDNVYIASAATLKIASGWTGNASAYISGASSDYGAVLPTANATATGDYTGNLSLENNAMSAGVFKDTEGLRVSGVCVQTKNVNGVQWYLNNAAAVTAAGNNADKVINLYTAEALDLAGKTVYVNFNGQQNVTVSDSMGSGKLYGIDTATGFTGAAAATATGVAAEPFAVDPLTGITYVAKDGHFYPIQVRNDGYGLRTNDMGIYFNAVIDCNPAIQNCIVGYGIDGTLDESFGIDNYLTGGVEDQYPTGGAFYGYINGIMGAGVGNDAETGVAPILTRLWVKLSNGSAEQTIYGADRAKSFKDVMVAINSSWGSLVDSHATVLDMYETYYDVMSTWDLTTIDDAYKAQN